MIKTECRKKFEARKPNLGYLSLRKLNEFGDEYQFGDEQASWRVKWTTRRSRFSRLWSVQKMDRVAAGKGR